MYYKKHFKHENGFSNHEGRLGHALKKHIKELNDAGNEKSVTKLVDLLNTCIEEGLNPESENLAKELIADSSRNFMKAYFKAYGIFMKGDGYGVL